MQAFCNNKLTFYYQYSAVNVFLSVLKLLVNNLFPSTCNVRNTIFRHWHLHVYRPGVWIKNGIIVIRDEISIIVRISYNEMYTNKTDIQRNKV